MGVPQQVKRYKFNITKREFCATDLLRACLNQ